MITLEDGTNALFNTLFIARSDQSSHSQLHYFIDTSLKFDILPFSSTYFSCYLDFKQSISLHNVPIEANMELIFQARAHVTVSNVLVTNTAHLLNSHHLAKL